MKKIQHHVLDTDKDLFHCSGVVGPKGRGHISPQVLKYLLETGVFYLKGFVSII